MVVMLVVLVMLVMAMVLGSVMARSMTRGGRL